MTQEDPKEAKDSTKEKQPAPQKDFCIIAIFKKMLGFNYMKYGTKKKF